MCSKPWFSLSFQLRELRPRPFKVTQWPASRQDTRIHNSSSRGGLRTGWSPTSVRTANVHWWWMVNLPSSLITTPHNHPRRKVLYTWTQGRKVKSLVKDHTARKCRTQSGTMLELNNQGANRCWDEGIPHSILEKHSALQRSGSHQGESSPHPGNSGKCLETFS